MDGLYSESAWGRFLRSNSYLFFISREQKWIYEKFTKGFKIIDDINESHFTASHATSSPMFEQNFWGGDCQSLGRETRISKGRS